MKKVLIIEDDDFIAQMYEKRFKQKGYQAKVAENGQIGLDLIEQDNPDIIILDIVLPQLDGFEILKRIKSNPLSKDIPVLLLSNLGEKENIERGLNLGANDYAIKANFTPSEIIEKVENLLLE